LDSSQFLITFCDKVDHDVVHYRVILGVAKGPRKSENGT
jgi:hypothetical protein